MAELGIRNGLRSRKIESSSLSTGTMKKFILSIVFILSVQLSSYSQTLDSVRLERIDSTLREYGRQQTIANKITLVSITSIIIGTAIGMPAEPLLVVNTIADLTTLLVSSKSNKKLAKHKSK